MKLNFPAIFRYVYFPCKILEEIKKLIKAWEIALLLKMSQLQVDEK